MARCTHAPRRAVFLTPWQCPRCLGGLWPEDAYCEHCGYRLVARAALWEWERLYRVAYDAALARRYL